MATIKTVPEAKSGEVSDRFMAALRDAGLDSIVYAGGDLYWSVSGSTWTFSRDLTAAEEAAWQVVVDDMTTGIDSRYRALAADFAALKAYAQDDTPPTQQEVLVVTRRMARALARLLRYEMR